MSEFRCDGYIYELIPKRWTGSTIGSIKSFLVSTRIDLSFCQKRSNSKSDNYQILFPSVSCHLVYDGVPYVVDFINVKFNSKMCINILSCPSPGRTNIVHVTDKTFNNERCLSLGNHVKIQVFEIRKIKNRNIKHL